MKFLSSLAAALVLALPLAAWAHDSWLLPSSTVLSGDDAWITVDAAVGNDKFYFNHRAMRLDNLAVAAPDGSAVAPQNVAAGHLRGTFDLNLSQRGTYRIAVVNDGVFARWEENGQPRRWFGKPADLQANVPAGAAKVQVSQSYSRVETFVTAGKPSKVKPVGQGLELALLSHPNDLYAGESATFQLLIDGVPAPGLKVNVVRGGGRHRDQVGETELTSDAAGKFSIEWPQAGMYWLHADAEDGKTTVAQAAKRRLAYTATLEVLPQ